MFVGVDYHKRYSVVTMMDERGQILHQKRLNNDPQTLRNYAKRLPEGTQIALEATGHWYYFYELLEDIGHKIYLAHPLKTRAIAEAKIKTDGIDSRILAHLLRADLLPTSYIPPRQIRDQREVLRYRASLVSLQTSIKNKVRAILSKNGITIDSSNIFGKKAKEELRSLKLRDCYRVALQGYIKVAEVINELLKEVSKRIEAVVEDTKEAKLLMTIPGIGYYSALLIVSEIGDINRFPTARKLCSYAGLVPSVHSSGGKSRYGSITKQGSRWLRWILIELSYHFVNGSKRMRRIYWRVRRTHGANTAKVAVAREMLKVIYYILRDRRPYIKD